MMQQARSEQAQEIRQGVDAFEAALASSRTELQRRRIGPVLLAVDGSNQDATEAALAAAIAQRFDAPLWVVYAYPGPTDPDREGYLQAQARALAEAGLDAKVVQRPGDQLKPFEQILAAREAHGCELIVVEAPYLEDFADLGKHSVGTSLDMLLGRSPAPLLVVRRPQEPPHDQLDRLLLPLTPFTDKTVLAASWACELVGKGTLWAVALVEPTVLEAVGQVMQSGVDINELDEDRLAGLHRPRVAGLIAALQRRAAEGAFACRVTVREGELASTVTKMAADNNLAIVTSGLGQPEDLAYQQAHAVIRQSPQPVLVV